MAQVRDKIQYRSPAGNDIYGLYNVNERIHLNFGEKFGISIESDYGDGTVVSILCPIWRKGYKKIASIEKLTFFIKKPTCSEFE